VESSDVVPREGDSLGLVHRDLPFSPLGRYGDRQEADLAEVMPMLVGSADVTALAAEREILGGIALQRRAVDPGTKRVEGDGILADADRDR
jgi:hypothetical protein